MKTTKLVTAIVAKCRVPCILYYLNKVTMLERAVFALGEIANELVGASSLMYSQECWCCPPFF